LSLTHFSLRCWTGVSGGRFGRGCGGERTQTTLRTAGRLRLCWSDASG
jgi:hypothetical protein